MTANAPQPAAYPVRAAEPKGPSRGWCIFFGLWLILLLLPSLGIGATTVYVGVMVTPQGFDEGYGVITIIVTLLSALAVVLQFLIMLPMALFAVVGLRGRMPKALRVLICVLFVPAMIATVCGLGLMIRWLTTSGAW